MMGGGGIKKGFFSNTIIKTVCTECIIIHSLRMVVNTHTRFCTNFLEIVFNALVRRKTLQTCFFFKTGFFAN